MKIKLTENEIAEIVKEWAMHMYRTKNVSVMYEVDLEPARPVISYTPSKKYPFPSMIPAKLNAISMDVEVILTDSDFTGVGSELANQAIKNVQRKHGVTNEAPTPTDNFTGPSLDGGTLP